MRDTDVYKLAERDGASRTTSEYIQTECRVCCYDDVVDDVLDLSNDGTSRECVLSFDELLYKSTSTLQRQTTCGTVISAAMTA